MKWRKVAYLIISSFFTVFSLVAAVFIFPQAFYRCWEALCDLWESAAYYFFFVTGAGELPLPSVTEYSEVLDLWFWLPETWDQFQALADAYWALLFDEVNWNYFLFLFGGWVERISRYLLLLLPFALIIGVLASRVYKEPNNDHDKDTKPLQLFKKFTKAVYQPVKSFVLGFVAFLKDNDWIWKPWAALWAINMNLASIIIGFLAFYFYFAASCDLENIFLQIFKFFIDMQFMFLYIPLIGWLMIGYFCLDHIRKYIGRQRIKILQARNCGFINELPIVTLSCGSMGKKKTTLITDMTITTAMMFRQKALSILRKADMKFPDFPWLMLELDLKERINDGRIKTKAECRKWVEEKKRQFEGCPFAGYGLYGYDCRKFPMEFDDGLAFYSLFDVMETYVQAYFIYAMPSSLVLSNYSVRTSESLKTKGNFPDLSINFFPDKTERDGVFCHVLDFDVLRLGQKVEADNPRAGSFEFGVVAITEIGKERGNQYDEKEAKAKNDRKRKNDEPEEATIVNDGFNKWLKMCRHSSTVDFYPFIRVFSDEQRPMNLGADARELCEILGIQESGEEEFLIPFYTLEDMVSEAAYKLFQKIYHVIRVHRGDNTLLVHILKHIVAYLFARNLFYKNRFSFSTVILLMGDPAGETQTKKYFLMNHKIYARRFSTDAFSDFCEMAALSSKAGLNDYDSYETVKASVEELKLQNSYFVDFLFKGYSADQKDQK